MGDNEDDGNAVIELFGYIAHRDKLTVKTVTDKVLAAFKVRSGLDLLEICEALDVTLTDFLRTHRVFSDNMYQFAFNFFVEEFQKKKLEEKRKRWM